MGIKLIAALCLSLFASIVFGQSQVLLNGGQATSNLPISVLPVQYVNCTNGSTGSADVTLLQAAATLGGNISIMSPCTINATVTLNSNTSLTSNGNVITGAAATNWSGSAVSHFFAAASNATNISVTNSSFACPATATGSVHVLQFPSGNSHIKVLNNYFNLNNACGNATAMIGSADTQTIGNTAVQDTNSCYDAWNGTSDDIIADNWCSTGTGTSAIYGILWTGFNTNDTAGTITTHANIHDNIIYLNNQATFGDVGIYMEGYSSCSGSAADWADVHDNQIYLATGVWAQAIRADGCANHDYFHDNTVLSDGTASSLPAIEAKATTTDIHIDHNHAYNFSGPTTGSDAGVFNNESTNGTLFDNTCTGTSCSAPLYAGQVAGSASDQPFTKPYTKWQWGVPSGIMSSATMGTNGAYTAATSQPVLFTPGFWGFYPAGYICSTGQSAGVFWTVPSSQTAGTIWNVALPAGTAPYVPASPTAFSCAAGTGTQTTSVLEAIATLAIPGGSMGTNGSLYFKTLGARTNNSDTVIQEVTFGGQEAALASTISVNWYGLERTIMNTGAANSQIVMGATSGGTDAVLAGNGSGSFGVGTANSQNLVFNCQINTATDWCFIYGGRVEVSYAP